MTKLPTSQDIISKKEIVGYIFVGLWVLLLAMTNYSSWMANYLHVSDIESAAMRDFILAFILLGPIVVVAFPVSNKPAQVKSAGGLNHKPNAQIILNTAIIVIGAYVGYLFIHAYFY